MEMPSLSTVFFVSVVAGLGFHFGGTLGGAFAEAILLEVYHFFKNLNESIRVLKEDVYGEEPPKTRRWTDRQGQDRHK